MSTTPSRRRTAPALVAAAAVALLALTGCASGQAAARSGPAGSAAPSASPTGYTVVAQPTLRPGDPLPEPTGTVVLTVSGELAGGKAVHLDLATIEKMGLVEYSVDDKQAEGHRVTFRGVLLRSLLDTVGATGGTTLHTTAINDYAVDIPMSDVDQYPVMLATSVDGQRMTVERYGPTRVVYPTDSFDLDPVTYDPRWIWQLKSLEVE
ncbi:molybdopterin-dependent oxidoreductase [Phycicoccus sonneratiae]|uniref:Molybdopterin-dependent oxidoreductase n=1 Tax=Phycicoccus sonneratiae TaxID=2807628 RepID=A0ABS2CI88_9MICO|nr:molybdopterin-dependent oxidoreductase [Phycicoccus sonneraticus]MBM6399591.1 molybdopterin-dependent oxidoreductase [Phycicoccus sonneraticus]